jgi:hypothetical protein
MTGLALLTRAPALFMAKVAAAVAWISTFLSVLVLTMLLA